MNAESIHPEYRYDALVVAANPAIDSYYVMADFHLSAVNRAQQVFHTAGGKGNNMARAMTCLGARPLSLGIVAGASGEFILKELDREGIEHDCVWGEGECRRSNTILIPGHLDATVILERGQPVGVAVCDRLTEYIQRHLEEAPFLVFTSSLPPDFPTHYYASLIRQFANHSVRIGMDCSGEPLRLAVEAGAQIVKINREEFCLAFGGQYSAWSWQDAQEIFSRYVPNGLEILIITDGEQGAYVLSRAKPSFRVFTPVKAIVSSAGAGDSFFAGLIAALARGQSLEAAARLASAASAANLQELICGNLDRQLVEEYLERTEIEYLNTSNPGESTTR